MNLPAIDQLDPSSRHTFAVKSVQAVLDVPFRTRMKVRTSRGRTEGIAADEGGVSSDKSGIGHKKSRPSWRSLGSYVTSSPSTYLTFDEVGLILFPLRCETEQEPDSFRPREPLNFLIGFTDELIRRIRAICRS